MINKTEEIKRSYNRALREGYPIILNAEGIEYYLGAIYELEGQISTLKMMAIHQQRRAS